MQHRVVALLCSTLALGGVLACGSGNKGRDTTVADSNKTGQPAPAKTSAAQAATAPIPKNCVVVLGQDQWLPVIQRGESDYGCVSWTAAQEGSLQTPTTQTILVSGCAGGSITVTTALYLNAGNLTDASGGDYKGNPAFVVGTITNNSNCDWVGKHVTLLKQTSYYIVVYGNGTKTYLVPPSGGNEQLKFVSCADDNAGGTQASGDLAYLKDDTDKCKHTDTRPVAGRGDSAKAHPTPFDIDDSGVLWLACGVDCCYSTDPGNGGQGRGGRGGRGNKDTATGAAVTPKKKA